MYNIDLLKNQGIPKKSTPFLTMMTTAAISIPLLLFLFIGIEYMANQIQIKFSSNMLDRIQEKFETMPYDQRLDNRLKQEFGFGLGAVEEIRQGVNRNIQWTTTLNEITSHLPENLAIADFDVRRNVEKSRVEDPQAKGRKKEVETVVRTLKMTIFNLKPDRSNDDAQNYIRELNNSSLLKENMESAKISVIRVEDFEGQMLPCYIIECVFKTGYEI
jgi:hypothetical protein